MSCKIHRYTLSQRETLRRCKNVHPASKDPRTQGQVRVSINSGIVFPIITKHEYERMGLHGVIPSERIFFWDDLHPQSPLCENTTGRCFREAPGRMATVKPRFTITERELNYLRQLIFPVAPIDLPKRLPKRDDDQRADHERRLKLLDHHQESIARKYDGGRRIITGPSGSG